MVLALVLGGRLTETGLLWLLVIIGKSSFIQIQTSQAKRRESNYFFFHFRKTKWVATETNPFRLTWWHVLLLLKAVSSLPTPSSESFISSRPGCISRRCSCKLLAPKWGGHRGKKFTIGTTPPGGHGGFVKMWHLWVYKQVKRSSTSRNYLNSGSWFHIFPHEMLPVYVSTP